MCQLEGMTKAQLDKFTKEQLIQLALECVVTETITSREFDNKTGELINLKTTSTNAYPGAVIETKEVSKTFYGSGQVNIISVNVTDKIGKITQTNIKHDIAGKTPPVATTAAVEIKP
jgi:hypothetical protein